MHDIASIAEKKPVGLVLAGGQSRRMGVDKTGLKPFGPRGVSMVARAYALVSAFARPAFVSCNGDAFRQYPCVHDSISGYGPLAGLAAGMEMVRKTEAGSMLVLACDLPLISPQILRTLLDFGIRVPNMAAIFFQNSMTGSLETLVAIYNQRAGEYIANAMKRGEQSLRKIIPPEQCAILPYGPDLAPFFLNCNRPEDFKHIQNIP